jgi:hypothetical protein
MYNNYLNYIKEICQTNNLTTFKSNNYYRDILEHVSNEVGDEYLKLIQDKTKISNEEIKSFCSLNDSVGCPLKFSYEIGEISPTSLRYIYHSHLILSYLSFLNLDSNDIVEIGGGYGGLCLALKKFAPLYNIKINSYTIIDFDDVIKLQEKYHKIVNCDDVNYISSNTFGSSLDKNNLFLISNYAFSEINRDIQNKYIEKLFPKVLHGFMCWNFIDLYNFGFKIERLDIEEPMTGDKNYNKYVYF